MRRPCLLLLVLALLAPGCGSNGDDDPPTPRVPVLGQRGAEPEAATKLGFPAFATKNTTRVGGADPVADAAAVAQAVFPSRSPATRPAVVALVDSDDWRVGISAAQLMASPLRAPVLLSDGDDVPPATDAVLDELRPRGRPGLESDRATETARPRTGTTTSSRPARTETTPARTSTGERSPAAATAQVIRVGPVAVPDGLRAKTLRGRGPFELARAVDRLHAAVRGEASRSVVVAGADRPQYAMPAAGWAAKSGDPVLWTRQDRLPAATRAAIQDRPTPRRIYVLGPSSAVSESVVRELERLGRVTRIGDPDPVRNAIAFARYRRRGFGWGADRPGHGLVFASAARPQDAAAAAPLSAAGSYGPLLLLPDAGRLPPALSSYLLDIRPGYYEDPAREGVYNHGWVIGDEDAVSLDVQARIDSLLEIQPVDVPSSP